jgi:hypothetical protein
MNAQIKSLIERAEYRAQKQSGSDWEVHVETDRQLVFEKFAELIVHECLAIAKNWEDQLESAKLLKESNAAGIVAYRIARQFGVKQ